MNDITFTRKMVKLSHHIQPRLTAAKLLSKMILLYDIVEEELYTAPPFPIVPLLFFCTIESY
jgi:hypothetical protein